MLAGTLRASCRNVLHGSAWPFSSAASIVHRRLRSSRRSRRSPCGRSAPGRCGRFSMAPTATAPSHSTHACASSGNGAVPGTRTPMRSSQPDAAAPEHRIGCECLDQARGARDIWRRGGDGPANSIDGARIGLVGRRPRITVEHAPKPREPDDVKTGPDDGHQRMPPRRGGADRVVERSESAVERNHDVSGSRSAHQGEAGARRIVPSRESPSDNIRRCPRSALPAGNLQSRRHRTRWARCRAAGNLPQT